MNVNYTHAWCLRRSEAGVRSDTLELEFHMDLLSAVEGRTALEREVKLYQERLLASQRAWDASKQELTQLRKRCQELDVSLKASREATTASQSRNSCFREKLTALLCSRFDTAESTEDAILERIRELGIEEESQRRLKTQKERLESKEVHMNLLRQKIAQLQQEKEARSALAVERDEAHLAMRKLEKKLERMQKELSACQEHNTELKAKLADTNELKLADFREVVSSMLGLNMTSHDPPDYEIIKCLERLLHSHRHHHHHHFVPCACLQDMAAEQGSCSHCRVEIPH